MSARTVVTLALVAAAVGCGTDDWVFCERNVCPGATTDAAVDEAVDATVDATEAPTDVADDTQQDVGVDAAADASVEASVDVDAEAPEDVPVASADVRVDVRVDVVADVVAEDSASVAVDVRADLPADLPTDVAMDVAVDVPPSCPAPRRMCGASCLDVSSDALNCGGCSVVCAAGQLCVGGVCTTPAVVGAGSPCRADADCGAGGLCQPSGAGFPDGYCLYGCAPTSPPGTACSGAVGACVSTGAQNLCFRRCVPGRSDGCRPGYICLDVSPDRSFGVCYPSCAPNPSIVCGAHRCDVGTGQCITSCAASSACSSGSFCDASRGMCECGATTNCGTANRCYPRVGITPGYCGCASNAGCSSGRTCDTASGRCL